MPKRTNAFQQLVRRIEQALHDTKASVQESVLLLDHASQAQTEVDILIRLEAGGREYRTAVECRAHRRAQGPPWIRELAKKRDGCRLDKMIAVSASGFSKPALRLAKTERIEALTVVQATTADWQEQVLPYAAYSIHTRQCQLEPGYAIWVQEDAPFDGTALSDADYALAFPDGQGGSLTGLIKEAVTLLRSMPGAPVRVLREIPEPGSRAIPIDVMIVPTKGTRLVTGQGASSPLLGVEARGVLRESVSLLNKKQFFLYGNMRVGQVSGKALEKEVAITFVKGDERTRMALSIEGAVLAPPAMQEASNFALYWRRQEEGADWQRALGGFSATLQTKPHPRRKRKRRKGK